MQKINLVWNILLTTAIVVLMVLFFTKKNMPMEDKAPQILTDTQLKKIQSGASKIVFVNMDTLYTKYKYVDELKKQLEQTQKAKQKELETKYIALEREVGEFREIAARLSQSEAEKQQAALMEKEQHLMQLREKLSAELYNNEAEMNEKLSQKINDYLKKYKTQMPYDFVLSYTKGGGILYTNDSLDITNGVLLGLNEDYELNKKK
ncbi:MAG: OmpH family outer membrane protein [Bacteroidia bacterium]|nr:OmpH family outer membrane protein [Bacteroidia bacterium]